MIYMTDFLVSFRVFLKKTTGREVTSPSRKKDLYHFKSNIYTSSERLGFIEKKIKSCVNSSLEYTVCDKIHEFYGVTGFLFLL